jgi:hypothetical protein
MFPTQELVTYTTELLLFIPNCHQLFPPWGKSRIKCTLIGLSKLSRNREGPFLGLYELRLSVFQTKRTTATNRFAVLFVLCAAALCQLSRLPLHPFAVSNQTVSWLSRASVRCRLLNMSSPCRITLSQKPFKENVFTQQSREV